MRAARLALVLLLAAVPAAGAAPGAWLRVPPAPIAPAAPVAGLANAVTAWTGSRMLVFGRAQPTPPWSVDVAAAYAPATRTWRRLAPLPGPRGNYEGRYWAAWTGTRLLVLGPFDFQSYSPATGRWRRLAAVKSGGAGGLVVWTGRELIDWGGGCCGDASNGGSAYDPARNVWRRLAASPLAPSQQPLGAWTGRELVVVVSGLDPDGKAYPARMARAAAYDPATRTWRRIAPPPVRLPGAVAVWDGREVLVVGRVHAGLAYDPAADRWRRIAPMPSGRTGFATAWTGKRLLVWGGTAARTGLSYDPAANRWSALPAAPLSGRLAPAAVWTGRAMIVWGGRRADRPLTDGASFRPAAT